MRNRTSSLLVALTVVAAPLCAASPGRVVVPLSDPGQPATVEASLVMGSLHVVAGPPGQVTIDAVAEKDQGHDTDRDHDATDRAGVDERVISVIAGRASDQHDHDHERSRMHRIPNASLDLSAEEDHNKVKISTSSWAHEVVLTIHVPPASSLTLSTVTGDEVTVDGVSGELDLHNTNGDIRVTDARGPVNATTVNGDIKVVFTNAMASASMAFSTLNGDVDLTLPANLNANVRMRSDNGDIYSDFDVSLLPRETKVEKDQSKGKYRVSIAKELTGKIGAGGPELFLKTFNGDLLLRKGKG